MTIISFECDEENPSICTAQLFELEGDKEFLLESQQIRNNSKAKRKFIKTYPADQINDYTL